MILPAIALTNVEAFEVTCQMIGSTGVNDPVRRLIVGGRRGRIGGARVLGVVVMIKAVATICSFMTPISAKLATRALTAAIVPAVVAIIAPGVVVIATATAVVPSAVMAALAALTLLRVAARGTTT
jgi:hypothetical protein